MNQSIPHLTSCLGPLNRKKFFRCIGPYRILREKSQPFANRFGNELGRFSTLFDEQTRQRQRGNKLLYNRLRRKLFLDNFCR